MIELAPNHKYGLPIRNPVMLAGGTIGYGDAIPYGLDLSSIGAAVVGPFLRRGCAGRQPPRLGETDGGFVLETGRQNRGVNAAARRFAKFWPDLGCPVVAQIADTQPRMAGAVAERLSTFPSLAGFEIVVPAYAVPNDVRDLVASVVRHSDLPVLAKLPLANASAMAAAAVEAEADGLVIGQPLGGAAVSSGLEADETVLSGPLFGPLTFSSMLLVLQQIAALELGTPLIACGGIYTLWQARQALAVGADGLQLDAVVWTEPGVAAQLAGELGQG